MKTCMFCGPTAAEMTAEHVMPLWLSRLFRDYAGVIRYRSVHKEDDLHTPNRSPLALVDRTRTARTMDLSVREVCQPCNNHWMSELEGIAQPILSPLIRGSATTLGDEQRLAIVAWIVKFAMVMENARSADMKRFFTQVEREQFMDTLQPPPNTWMYLARHHGSPLTHTNQKSLVSSPTPRPARELHVTTVAIGRLAFQFIARRWVKEPRHDSLARQMAPILAAWEPATVSIWPSDAKLVEWPPRAHLNDEGLKAFCNRWGTRTAARTPR